MELDSLQALYVEGLKDLYSAENQILKALPRMIKVATSPELKKAFTKHERQTEQHVARIERICAKLGESPKGKKCHGMEGLLEEGKELIQEKPAPEVLDAGLISAAQHVEHYEMAGYGTLRTYAQLLGHTSQADLLQQTLDEEGTTDKLLTQLAEAINIEAEFAGSAEQERAKVPFAAADERPTSGSKSRARPRETSRPPESEVGG